MLYNRYLLHMLNTWRHLVVGWLGACAAHVCADML
jgi:hypothetical protein